MEKQVVLVTQAVSTALTYVQWLHDFFGDRVVVETFSVEQNNYMEMPQDRDLYIVACTSSDALEQVSALIPAGRPVITPTITFYKKEIAALRELPRGTHAILVNLSIEMGIETIAELNRLGVTQIEFTPVYPGSSYPPDVELAITPGETRYVPPTVLQVLDLGPRVFSADTLLEIAMALDFTWFPGSPAFLHYEAELADSGQNLASLWKNKLKMESYMDILMGALEMGVLGLETDGRIITMNSVAAEMLGVNRAASEGQLLPLVCPKLNQLIPEKDRRQKSSRLVRLEGTYLNLSTVPVVWQETLIGCFVMLQSFTEEEERQHQFRLQMYHRGYQSKYVFSDILGESEIMRQTKQIAAKMAQTESAILLTGESGTGKELFAHSIHHASSRREMPFVAVNCAALSETLLESELFGYDEGAFTGAKKGGKLGLFEYAHMGTLFLDEIEGMSQHLQVKLLRVLQEKEFMRVGGNRIIPTDVRIIAASNEDILERVRQGSFRKDLYYRLNTLPIQLPPLRERGEDLFLIADHLIQRTGASFTFAPETRAILRRYRWDGNIRELTNLVEYLAMLGKEQIQKEDLPSYILAETAAPCMATRVFPEDGTPWQAARGREERFWFVLTALGKAQRGMGRGALTQEANKQGLPLTEQEIRDVLTELNRQGLVSASRGRGGSSLTRAGRMLLERGEAPQVEEHCAHHENAVGVDFST